MSNSITIPITDTIEKKIKALSVLAGIDAQQIVALLTQNFDSILNEQLFAAIGGNTPQALAAEHSRPVETSVPKRSITEMHEAKKSEFADVSGFAEDLGGGDPEFHSEGSEDPPAIPTEDAEEISSALQEMEEQSMQPDNFIDALQSDLDEGNVDSSENFRDPDLAAIESDGVGITKAGPLPSDFGTANLESDEGQADFFMSALEGRKVRTGVGNGQRPKRYVSPTQKKLNISLAT